jgi:peroxiredoxin
MPGQFHAGPALQFLRVKRCQGRSRLGREYLLRCGLPGSCPEPSESSKNHPRYVTYRTEFLAASRNTSKCRSWCVNDCFMRKRWQRTSMCVPVRDRSITWMTVESNEEEENA